MAKKHKRRKERERCRRIALEILRQMRAARRREQQEQQATTPVKPAEAVAAPMPATLSPPPIYAAVPGLSEAAFAGAVQWLIHLRTTARLAEFPAEFADELFAKGIGPTDAIRIFGDACRRVQ